MSILKQLEHILIYPYAVTDYSEEHSDATEDLLHLATRGSYVETLQKEECKKVLCPLPEERLENLTAFFEENLKTYLENSGANGQYTVLCIGVSCLQLFVQNNFSGPMVGPDAEKVLYTLSEGNTKEHIHSLSMNELLLDTEGVYNLMYCPEYLLLARTIFVNLRQHLFLCKSVLWWCCRYNFVHQKIAEEHSPMIYDCINEALTELELSDFFDGPFRRELNALLHIEIGNTHLHYQNIREARFHVSKSKEILGFETTLTGALGKRTKWQQRDLPQLVLKVTYKNRPILASEYSEPEHLAQDLPKDVALNDDTRLEKTKFQEEDEDVIPNITPLEQMALLADFQIITRANAKDKQTELELKAYVSSLIQHPKNWSTQMCALLARTRIEVSENRAMHRALSQIDELYTAVTRPEPSRFERLKLIYSSLLMPQWILQQELAYTNQIMGSIKTALSMYEKLELWDDVIACNTILDFRSRSATVIKKLLEKENTPKLWCLLGDATDIPAHYQTAWELSNHKSGKAQRCLGNYYYARNDFKKAVEHFEISVKLNTLQYDVWQRLAYSSLRLKEWEICANAYRRCTLLEPDSFECWNNLSQAYLQLKQTQRAWKSLQEALRCNTTNWKLWVNYMQVSTSLGYMSQAIHAYNKILPLHERYVNIEILGCVVKAVLTGHIDPAGVSMRDIHKKTSDLLAKLTREVSTEPELWFLYASMVYGVDELTKETRHTAMQYFRKAVAASTQNDSWVKNTKNVHLVLMRCLRLMEVVHEVESVTDAKTLHSEFYSLKMLLNGIIVYIKRNQYEIETGELVPALRDPYNALEKEVEYLTEFALKHKP